ncbi:MAG: PfkB family carbohydrate kinase [Spirochaetaceae bacterium]|jgi:fructokinase|nr:PfkB family carbohydrate kinase [Spirochaetaceae bacterium]
MNKEHQKKIDVAALGELLIDFTPAGQSPAGMTLYERNPGGAPANVLCALARLGLTAAFIGKVGSDAHGRFLRSVLEENHVDTSGLITSDSVFTTLAFVDLSPCGERDFSFARKPGADTCLTPDELRRDILEACRIFHFGSLSLTNEPARSATVEAAAVAKKAGALISYDPNYRAPLWAGEAAAIKGMRSVLHLADLVKMSEEEVPLITGSTDFDTGVAALFDAGVSCAVITRGKKGAEALTRTAHAAIPVPDVPVTDTTGAGDAFWGGFLCQILAKGVNPDALNKKDLEECVRFANAVASLCVQKRGAIPAMPTRAEADVFYTKAVCSLT